MKKSRKGYTLVSANGRVMHKRIADFKAQIMASKRSKALKDELINELDVNDFIDRMNISTGVKDICEILKEYISLFVGCENKKIK